MAFIVFIILVALVFDFFNGFHDSANSIATVVSTRVLTPRVAVGWAAFFNLAAAFLFGVNVAKTVGTGLVDIAAVNQHVILAALLGAIVWDIITWYFGLPTSSSHALIGGYAGAAIAKAGFGAIIPSGWTLTLVFIVLAPLIGMVVSFLLMMLVEWIFYRKSASKINRFFRKLQLVSAAAYSLGHGANDAQKTMGIITGLLVTSGLISSFEVPWWVVIAAYSSIALGTMFGGWRIVKTMGQKITRLKPSGGFCAETAGAMTLLLTAFGGIPVSTTHTITGAIMGVGATTRASAVRWGVAGNIVLTWILTIPASAAVAWVCYLLISVSF